MEESLDPGLYHVSEPLKAAFIPLQICATFRNACHCLLVSQFTEASLNLSEEEFVAKYDFKRTEKPVVLHCKAGIRARRAYDALREGKYAHLDEVGVYQGSFDDWVIRGGTVVRGDGCEVVDFDEVARLLRAEGMRLVDVRNPGERKSPGMIPGSVNIPRKTAFTSMSIT